MHLDVGAAAAADDHAVGRVGGQRPVGAGELHILVGHKLHRIGLGLDRDLAACGKELDAELVGKERQHAACRDRHVCEGAEVEAGRGCDTDVLSGRDLDTLRRDGRNARRRGQDHHGFLQFGHAFLEPPVFRAQVGDLGVGEARGICQVFSLGEC
ncbi:hypothetical protein D3C81_1482710 [compost metagenome]